MKWKDKDDAAHWCCVARRDSDAVDRDRTVKAEQEEQGEEDEEGARETTIRLRRRSKADDDVDVDDELSPEKVKTGRKEKKKEGKEKKNIFPLSLPFPCLHILARLFAFIFIVFRPSMMTSHHQISTRLLRTSSLQKVHIEKRKSSQTISLFKQQKFSSFSLSFF